MNKSIDPCQDFYGHVCGKYNDSEHGIAGLQLKFLTKVIDLIDPTKRDTAAYFKTTKIVFDQCREFNNEAKWINRLFEFLWTDEARNFLHPKLLLSNNPSEMEPNLTAAWQIAGVMSRLGVPIFGNLQSLRDYDLNPRDYLNQYACSSDGSLKVSLDRFIDFLAEVKEHLNAPNLNTTDLVPDVQALCVDLANETINNWEYRFENKLPDKATFRNLTHVTPNFMWEVFLNFSSNGTAQLDLIEEMDLDFKKYIFMEHLGRVFMRHNIRSVRLLSLLSLVERVRSMRELTCVQILRKLRLEPVLVKLYMTYYLNQTKKDRNNGITPILRAVSSAFSMLVTQISWLNAKDKEVIRSRLDSISLYDDGVPHWTEDDEERLERTVLFSADKHRPYLTNLFNGFKRIHDYDSSNCFDGKCHKLQDDSTLDTLERNAQYITYMNMIALSLGTILTPASPVLHEQQISPISGASIEPYFDPRYPLTVNFGNLGTITAFSFFVGSAFQLMRVSGRLFGHEIMHAFDHKLINNSYLNLSPESIKQYFEYSKDRCLAKDYGRFCNDHVDMCIDGAVTITENMPDIAGLKTAFMAYRFLKALSPTNSRVQLPGLEEYTEDQVFFVSSARRWCDRVETDREAMVGEFSYVHPPSKARVLITLRHVPQFAAAFQCPPGSPYAPLEICDVWGGMTKPSGAFLQHSAA